MPMHFKPWCVSKPSTPDHELRNNIKFVCEEKRMTGCSLIQSEGPCFNPNTAINHDSAMISRGGSRIRSLRVSSEPVFRSQEIEVASFGGSNIDHSAWEDKKNPSKSRFPVQVASFGGSNIDLSAWEDKKNPSESCFPTQVLLKKSVEILVLCIIKFIHYSWHLLRLSNDSKSCLLKPSIKRLLAAESPQGVLRTPDTVAKSRSQRVVKSL
ncbi:B2 protein [Capsicum baccatum]|uniref:B2 protein n=1 Tax=Capsicum baccatum TaxID=33114 RepID=A0A2G2XDY4_CAPBA|nr:B2 protein [Capsicum baccatum]